MKKKWTPPEPYRKMRTIVCEGCGKTFTALCRPERRYCTQECFKKRLGKYQNRQLKKWKYEHEST